MMEEQKATRSEVKGMEKKGYEGKITNAGFQHVKAPHQQPKGAVDVKKTTGKDLRSKAGSK